MYIVIYIELDRELVNNQKKLTQTLGPSFSNRNVFVLNIYKETTIFNQHRKHCNIHNIPLASHHGFPRYPVTCPYSESTCMHMCSCACPVMALIIP